MEKDKAMAIDIARDILENAKQYVILDTETTGLHFAQIVQIAITDLEGNPLLNTLIKPKNEIEPGATAIHGLTKEFVETAPSFIDVYPLIVNLVKNKVVLIYNASFDTNVLDYCCKLDNLPILNYEPFCIMDVYSTYIGEWNDYYNNYKWQKLPGGDHSALGDCLATLQVIREVAATPVIIEPNNVGLMVEPTNATL